MADGGSFNLHEVLRQLGIKDVSELEILKQVQPTLAVGDAGGIAPPLLAPLAYGGGRPLPTGTTYAGFRVRSCPGGTFIRRLRISSSVLADNTAVIVPIASATTYATGPTPLTLMQVGPKPVTSEISTFTCLNANAHNINDAMVFRITSNASYAFPELFYVPSGHIFELIQRHNTGGPYGMFLLHDVVAPSLTPDG